MNPDIGDSIQTLRVSVLKTTLLTLGIAVPLVSVVLVMQTTIRGDLDAATIWRSTFTLLFLGLAMLRHRLPFRPAAILLLALLVVTVFILCSRGGVAVGSVTLACVALTLGCVFFGRTGGALMFLALLGVLALSGFLLVSGNLPTPDPKTWNQLRADFWIRQIIAFLALGLALIATQLYINERLLAQSQRYRQLAERERQEVLQLQAAEDAREQEQLLRLKAQQALDESRRTEALARLSGGIAHDFNNTLTTILANAELAQLCIEDRDKVNAALEQIREASTGAAEMTRQLLALGRRQADSPVNLPMRATLMRLQGGLQRVLPASIQLEIDVEGEPAIWADPGQFERAFYNLVLNARDAMPSGGRISVQCGAPVGSIGFVQLSIRDQGHGMDEATLSCVFDPYFTTKGQKGTGLGLATVHAWVTGIGGRIEVTSTPGAGSEFTLLLPSARRSGTEVDSAHA